MNKPTIALLLLTVIATTACGSESTPSTAADGGDAAATPTPTGADAAVHKATCSPACTAEQVCLTPGACSFDARCIARTEVTCPDAGLCTAPMCAGELRGAALECICR